MGPGVKPLVYHEIPYCVRLFHKWFECTRLFSNVHAKTELVHIPVHMLFLTCYVLKTMSDKDASGLKLSCVSKIHSFGEN